MSLKSKSLILAVTAIILSSNSIASSLSPEQSEVSFKNSGNSASSLYKKSELSDLQKMALKNIEKSTNSKVVVKGLEKVKMGYATLEQAENDLKTIHDFENKQRSNPNVVSMGADFYKLRSAASEHLDAVKYFYSISETDAIEKYESIARK